MKSKILKAQFNKMCLGGLLLDMHTVALFSGTEGMTAIEVSPKGINLQPGPGNPLVLNSLDIRGPGYKYYSSILDFFPVWHTATPRKEFNMPVKNEIAEMFGVSAAFIGFSNLL